MVTWTIANLERDAADGGVMVAHWRVSAVDGDYTASSYGTCSFDYDATADGFIAFEALTEADVITWVQAQVDAESIEAALAADIAEQQAPATIIGLPW